MGELMKIEDGKTSSDMLTGCAPIDWIKGVANDFRYAWDQTVLDAKNLWNEFTSALRGTAETIREGWSWLWGNIARQPIVRQITGAVSYGVAVVKKGWQSLDACTKAMIKGSAIVAGAAAVLVGGTYALCAVAGAVASNAVLATGITLAAGALMRAFGGGVRFLYNFNWNQTDAQIEAEYQSKLTQIAGLAGGAVGAALGSAVCGWLPGTVIGKFNPVLAAKIKMAQPEIWEEAKEEFEQFFRSTIRMSIGIAFKNIYKNVRRYIKKLANNNRLPIPASWNNAIKAWGEPGSKSWSFASAIEDKIESIQNPILQNFAEELVDGFFDGCDNAWISLSYAV